MEFSKVLNNMYLKIVNARKTKKKYILVRKRTINISYFTRHNAFFSLNK